MTIMQARELFDAALWRPAADVYRCPDGWLVKFDLAGVRPTDVRVDVNEKCLVVTGIRRDAALAEGHCFHSMEISYNRFHRSLEFPCDLIQARYTVDYRDGMLLVRLFTEGSAP